MKTWQSNPNVKLLTDLTVPPFYQDQLDQFTPESIHLQQIGPFDPEHVVSSIKQHEGDRVLGADFGGDKGAIRLFEVQNGQLELRDDYTADIQGDDGKGYVACLQQAAAYAEAKAIPLGISWGGPMQGTVVEFHPKAKVFMSELQAQYDGDIAKISPSITACINDAPAGLISGAVEAYRQHKATAVIFAINGGGLGLGVLNNSVMFATEAGHVEGLAVLNDYQQTDQCGVFGATYTCIEHLGANKVGIESQWQTATGEYMRARDIEDQYKAGNALAGELYEHSAFVVAHMICGAAVATSIDISANTSAVVCHGGAFKFPYYGERVKQLIENHINGTAAFIMTKDYSNPSSNACLDGAAIAALTA